MVGTFWLFCFSLQIRAYNTLNPSNIGISTVEVQVDRNVNAPVFVRSYSKEISENIGLGQMILQVQATDADGVSARYTPWRRAAYTCRRLQVSDLGESDKHAYR